jgi:hypothetical protein
MDLFDTLTWAEILEKTTFMGTPTLTVLGWFTLKFIYFQTIIAFCFKFFYNCSIPWILQLLCSLIWNFLTHFQNTMHGMKMNET